MVPPNIPSDRDRAAIEKLLGSRWALAGFYSQVPLNHDVYTFAYKIYNETRSENVYIHGSWYRFIKVEAIPSSEEAKSIEWQTANLLNDWQLGLKYGQRELVHGLRKAFKNVKLNKDLMIDLVARYGNDDAKSMMAMAIDPDFIPPSWWLEY